MRTTIYLHSDRDLMCDRGMELGLEGHALGLFRFACCEVKVELEVDTTTGEATIVKIDDRKVEPKV